MSAHRRLLNHNMQPDEYVTNDGIFLIICHFKTYCEWLLISGLMLLQSGTKDLDVVLSGHV